MFCVSVVCIVCWALPRDYRIESNFWKFYLIKTGFTLDEQSICDFIIFNHMYQNFQNKKLWCQNIKLQIILIIWHSNAERKRYYGMCFLSIVVVIGYVHNKLWDLFFWVLLGYQVFPSLKLLTPTEFCKTPLPHPFYNCMICLFV